jgi:hypothetical protein
MSASAIQVDWTTLLSDGTSFPPFGNDNCKHPDRHDPAVELDCLRAILPRLGAENGRSRKVGTGADQVLIGLGVIGLGVIDEEERRADHTRIAKDTLSEAARYESCRGPRCMAWRRCRNGRLI